MKKLFVLAGLLLIGCATQERLTEVTSSENLLPYAESITPDYMRQHLEIIASDEFEGRATGEEGQKKAAAYIADFYSSIDFTPMGDDNTYMQKFNLNANVTDSLVYRLYQTENADTVLTNHSVVTNESAGEFIRMYGGNDPIEGSVVFAGFGVNDPDRNVANLSGASLQDKWVMIFEDIPYIVDGDTIISPDIPSNSRIGNILGAEGARGILMISENSGAEFNERAQAMADRLSEPSNMRLAYRDNQSSSSGPSKGIYQVSRALAATILELENEDGLETYKDSLTASIASFSAEETPYHLEYNPYSGVEQVETENVIAYLEGADPELKEETLVLMAHYDHIGITQPDESGDALNNGADDNGSGTTTLLSIANALHQAQQDGYTPKRSILFLHVTAEERGLLGSRYYSDHPVVPIENTVANFNADMIGRSDPAHVEQGNTDYVYLIGGEIISSELDSLVQAANDHSVGMTLDRGYNDLQDPNQFYRRSDHWNFGRLGVPFVFFFTGVHADYHRPSDTVDKIDFEKLSRVAQLIYTSSIEVTNYDGRPVVDNQMFIDITGQQPR